MFKNFGSDFAFKNARPCHAVVLTTIEADKLDWFDTNELKGELDIHRLRNQLFQLKNSQLMFITSIIAQIW